MEKIDLQAVAALPEQAQSCLKGFKKNTYAASFETYMDENRALWDSFHALFSSAEDITGTAGEVADCLVKTVEEALADKKGRIGKEQLQLDINLYMVSYVFPAILSCQEYPKNNNNAVKMADVICAKWKEAFPKYSISYTDFASIQGGFKQKLCYITTTVCSGLHKAPGCRELVVMKKYRDEYLIKQEGGAEVIEEYYDIAPTIVKRIAKEDDPEGIYLYLWEHYLKFCVAMIDAGQFEECRDTYERMVEELRQEYIITDHHDGLCQR